MIAKRTTVPLILVVLCLVMLTTMMGASSSAATTLPQRSLRSASQDERISRIVITVMSAGKNCSACEVYLSPDGTTFNISELKNSEPFNVDFVLLNKRSAGAAGRFEFQSPDGKHSIVITPEQDANDLTTLSIAVVEAGSAKSSPIGVINGAFFIGPPTWSHDQTKILLAELVREEQYPDIAQLKFHILSLDGSEPQAVVPDQPVSIPLQAVPYLAFLFHQLVFWTPDGQRIMTVGDVGLEPKAISLVVMDSNGKNTASFFSDASINALNASWSPDGQQLLFEQWASLGDAVGQIAVSSADGSEVYIFPDTVGARLPAWSPDGSQIAFITVAPREGISVWIMNPDGTERRKIFDFATQSNLQIGAGTTVYNLSWELMDAALLNSLPVPTTTPTPTPLPTNEPLPTTVEVVTANADWQPRTHNFDGVAMMLVPPGCFLMGSENSYGQVKPVHQQCIDTPFWIDQLEVTQGQFKQFGGQAALSSYYRGDNFPVEQVTWFEARDFCLRRGARLPTEREWEYAASGPDGLKYPWGNSEKTMAQPPVDAGSQPDGASWVGALDMIGGAAEWTSSLFKSYPYQVDDGRERTDDRYTHRVVRGGDFRGGGNAYRAHSYPSAAQPSIGFRCVRPMNDDRINTLPASVPGFAVVAEISLGSRPEGIAVNPTTNTIYITNFDDNSVSVIDGSSNTVTTTVLVGGNPIRVDVNPGTNMIYVSNRRDNSISVIDGKLNRVIATIEVGNDPAGIAVNTVTNTIYVVNRYDRTISVIDGAANKVNTVISPGVPLNGALAVNPTTNTVYVCNDSLVKVINGATNKVTNTLMMVVYCGELRVNPDTNMIYSADASSNKIIVANGATNRYIGGRDTGGGGEIEGMVIDSRTDTIYVASSGAVISKLVGNSNKVSDTLYVGRQLGQVALNPSTGLIYVIDVVARSVLVVQDVSN